MTADRFVFEHVTVAKAADRFELRPAAEFTVDVAAKTVDEVTLDPSRSVRAAVRRIAAARRRQAR